MCLSIMVENPSVPIAFDAFILPIAWLIWSLVLSLCWSLRFFIFLSGILLFRSWYFGFSLNWALKSLPHLLGSSTWELLNVIMLLFLHLSASLRISKSFNSSVYFSWSPRSLLNHLAWGFSKILYQKINLGMNKLSTARISLWSNLTRLYNTSF